jgi:hypothetical protein
MSGFVPLPGIGETDAYLLFQIYWVKVKKICRVHYDMQNPAEKTFQNILNNNIMHLTIHKSHGVLPRIVYPGLMHAFHL